MSGSAQTVTMGIQFLESNCSMVREGEREDASNFGNFYFPVTSVSTSAAKNSIWVWKCCEISGAPCQILFGSLPSSTLDAFPCIEVLNF